MTTDTVFVDFRFRVVGYWSLDVLVTATDIEHAKGKLRAEADVVGTTPQELNRRYHQRGFHGDSWCDYGLADFWTALEEVTLEQPVYHDDHVATLFVSAGEYPAGELLEYLVTVRYSRGIAYEVSIPATSLPAALDQIFDGKASLKLTVASSDSADLELGSDDLTEELALLAMLTPTVARYENDDCVVDYQLVHTVPAEGRFV